MRPRTAHPLVIIVSIIAAVSAARMLSSLPLAQIVSERCPDMSLCVSVYDLGADNPWCVRGTPAAPGGRIIACAPNMVCAACRGGFLAMRGGGAASMGGGGGQGGGGTGDHSGGGGGAAGGDILGGDEASMPSRCGNGHVDPGEECDAGDLNGFPQSNCSTDCRRVVRQSSSGMSGRSASNRSGSSAGGNWPTHRCIRVAAHERGTLVYPAPPRHDCPDNGPEIHPNDRKRPDKNAFFYEVSQQGIGVYFAKNGMFAMDYEKCKVDHYREYIADMLVGASENLEYFLFKRVQPGSRDHTCTRYYFFDRIEDKEIEIVPDTPGVFSAEISDDGQRIAYIGYHYKKPIRSSDPLMQGPYELHFFDVPAKKDVRFNPKIRYGNEIYEMDIEIENALETDRNGDYVLFYSRLVLPDGPVRASYSGVQVTNYESLYVYDRRANTILRTNDNDVPEHIRGRFGTLSVTPDPPFRVWHNQRFIWFSEINRTIEALVLRDREKIVHNANEGFVATATKQERDKKIQIPSPLWNGWQQYALVKHDRSSAVPIIANFETVVESVGPEPIAVVAENVAQAEPYTAYRRLWGPTTTNAIYTIPVARTMHIEKQDEGKAIYAVTKCYKPSDMAPIPGTPGEEPCGDGEKQEDLGEECDSGWYNEMYQGGCGFDCKQMKAPKRAECRSVKSRVRCTFGGECVWKSAPTPHCEEKPLTTAPLPLPESQRICRSCRAYRGACPANATIDKYCMNNQDGECVDRPGCGLDQNFPVYCPNACAHVPVSDSAPPPRIHTDEDGGFVAIQKPTQPILLKVEPDRVRFFSAKPRREYQPQESDVWQTYAAPGQVALANRGGEVLVTAAKPGTWPAYTKYLRNAYLYDFSRDAAGAMTADKDPFIHDGRIFRLVMDNLARYSLIVDTGNTPPEQNRNWYVPTSYEKITDLEVNRDGRILLWMQKKEAWDGNFGRTLPYVVGEGGGSRNTRSVSPGIAPHYGSHQWGGDHLAFVGKAVTQPKTMPFVTNGIWDASYLSDAYVADTGGTSVRRLGAMSYSVDYGVTWRGEFHKLLGVSRDGAVLAWRRYSDAQKKLHNDIVRVLPSGQRNVLLATVNDTRFDATHATVAPDGSAVLLLQRSVTVGGAKRQSHELLHIDPYGVKTVLVMSEPVSEFTDNFSVPVPGVGSGVKPFTLSGDGRVVYAFVLTKKNSLDRYVAGPTKLVRFDVYDGSAQRREIFTPENCAEAELSPCVPEPPPDLPDPTEPHTCRL